MSDSLVHKRVVVYNIHVDLEYRLHRGQQKISPYEEELAADSDRFGSLSPDTKPAAREEGSVVILMKS